MSRLPASARSTKRGARGFVAGAIVGALLAACAATRPPTTTPETAASPLASASSEASTPDPSAGVPPVASAPATPDDRCVQDSDCVIDSEVFEGPFTCCVGCVDRAISKDGRAAFRDLCAQKPPEQCPPVGCVRGPVHAVCESTHCVKRLGRAPRPAAGKADADCDPGGPTPRTCVPPSRTRGGSPGPNGCRAEPEGGVCRGCRPMFDGVEGGLCCYSGLSRFPRCDR